MALDINKALADLRASISLRRVWIALAREDIGDQHRRTALGPLWLLLNYLAFAGVFIFIFQRGAGIPNYVPYAATGLLVWFYIMETITNSVKLFYREEGMIKGTILPLPVYVMRLTMQSVFRSSYALVGCMIILIADNVPFSLGSLWAIVGIALIFLVTPAFVMVFAFVGTIFPDSQYVVSSLMRIGMFLTPVFWMNEATGGIRHIFYYWNPFTYFLEIVRIPIMTGSLPLRSLILCACVGVLGWIAAILLLGRFRKRIVFVL